MSTFTPLSADPIYANSREIGPGPSARTISTYRSIQVRCEACSHEWSAPPGSPADGGFSLALGRIRVGCPECGATGTMPAAAVAGLART